MGSYYDYRDDIKACSPGRHQFGMNGMCHVCRHAHSGLVSMAKRILELEATGDLGCQHRIGAAPNGMCTNCGGYLGMDWNAKHANV